MHTGLLVLGALVYLVIAVGLIVLSAKRSKPGIIRISVVTTVFSVFFSVSFLVYDGVVPIPALTVMVWCVIADCTKMYGSWGGLIWGFLPMLVQWFLLLIIALVFHKLARIWRRQSNNGA